MLGRAVLAVAVAAVFGIVSVVALAVSSDPAAGPRTSSSSLADRINRACGRFEVADWTTGDEFDRIAPGTVQVTCSRGDGSLFVVAVQR